MGLKEIILEDFGEISRKAFELKERKKASEGDAMESFGYSMALHDLRLYDDERFVWWDGREGFMPENPIGNPEDYLSIRDDYSALKSFIATTLDRGKVHAGGGTHGDTSHETNCADYISWLHQNNGNKGFRRNVERATVELLAEEFGREYASPDITPALAREEESFQNIYEGSLDKWFSSRLHRDNLHSALWRLGLDNVVSNDDREFKTRFEGEVKKTERPITLTEVYDQYAGSKADLKKSFEAGEFADTIHPHYSEMPEEFKVELREWHTRNQATRQAVREYSPQFNRLIGLLDVASAIGEHDERFSDLYAMLRQKAELRFMADSFAIAHHYSFTDIHRSILIALASVQQGTELQQFWLDNVCNDTSSDRVIVSVHGALTMYDSQEDRRQLITPVLQSLQQRRYDVDKGYQRHSGIGFYTEENLLDDILGHVTSLCFDKETFNHLDQEGGTLDFLQSRDIREGDYTFRFSRYTSQGTQELEATFDLTEDRVQGDGQLESSVRAYLQQGYELPSDVWVTSLEGRRISGTDSKVVDASGQELNGQYEGVVGLNYTHFGFLYNPESQTVILSEPLDSTCTMFGGRSGWEESRMGLDKVEKQVPYSQFQTVAQAGERINQLVAERRKSDLGDSLFGLDKKLDDSIAPYLTTVIHGRLIQNSDGLVQ
ncbi:MAG: hypothetical protein AABW92_01290 [Nanoarchaeota archaeon]